jgi:hypothetical protein
MVAAPDLPGVIAAFNDAGARHVIIGGFAVIALQFIRATDDSALLIPEDDDNHTCVLAALEALDARLKDGGQVTLGQIADRDHLRLYSESHGIVDLLKEGAAPLDFDTIYADSTLTKVAGVPMRFAGLASMVALKRLANRPRDRQDIEELEQIHGPLPIVPIPGLDD